MYRAILHKAWFSHLYLSVYFLCISTENCNSDARLYCSPGIQYFILGTVVMLRKTVMEIAQHLHTRDSKFSDRQVLSSKICCPLNLYQSTHLGLVLLTGAQPIVVWVGGREMLSHLFMLFISSWLEYHHSLFVSRPACLLFL